MINIIEKLKNVPKGTKFYSPILGWVTIVPMLHEENITVCTKHNTLHSFTKYGQYRASNSNLGECLLFPSKEVRTWESYQISSSHCDFKPFDKIVERYKNDIWVADMFSHYTAEDDYPYTGLGGIGYSECLSYNEETAKLIGTTDDYVR